MLLLDQGVAIVNGKLFFSRQNYKKQTLLNVVQKLNFTQKSLVCLALITLS